MPPKGKVLVRTRPPDGRAVTGTHYCLRFALSQLISSCMVCYVNNSPHEAAEQQLLQELLAGLGLAQPRGLAVALNDAVVPRAEWATRAVQPHDRLTIIRATQGG